MESYKHKDINVKHKVLKSCANPSPLKKGKNF